MTDITTIEFQHANEPLTEAAIRKALQLDEFVSEVTDALKSGGEVMVSHKREGTGPKIVVKHKAKPKP
jgi:hypothetical protein